MVVYTVQGSWTIFRKLISRLSDTLHSRGKYVTKYTRTQHIIVDTSTKVGRGASITMLKDCIVEC